MTTTTTTMKGPAMTATSDHHANVRIIIDGINLLAGSSASGHHVVIDYSDGTVGPVLFTAGSRPVTASQRLVKVGARITATGSAAAGWYGQLDGRVVTDVCPFREAAEAAALDELVGQ